SGDEAKDGDSVMFPIRPENDQSSENKDSQSHFYPMPTAEEEAIRRERHQNWLKKTGLRETGEHFERERILAFNKLIRSRPAADRIDEIEGDRKRFVEALFAERKK